MVTLYDTTLRDGTQREGLSLSVEDKLRIAMRLDDLGIDYIEGGFPGSNPKDIEFFERVRTVSFSHAVVSAFGSTCRKDTAAADDLGLQALLDTGCPAICIFGKAWDIHVTETLQTTLEENVRMVRDSVVFLKAAGRTVFFDAEHFFDGYRNNAGYAIEVCRAAAEAGADAIVMCDTNGGTLPHQVHRIVLAMAEEFDVPLGVHAHNDTACAVANSLVAVDAGCVHVQGTMNGYGERAGNADLTSIIPGLKLKMGVDCVTDDQLRLLTEVSHFVAETANLSPYPQQPYVGASAFAHKGGVHASAAARLPEAYEHIDPSTVGNLARVVVSELAGRASLVMKAAEMGIEVSAHDTVLTGVLDSIKEKEYRGYSFEAADASLEIMLRKAVGTHVPFFRLESFRCIMEKREDGRVMTEATIKVHVEGHRFIATAEGNGPVNALDRALRIAIGRYYPALEPIELTDFKVRVLDEKKGTGAVTRVLIESTDGDKSWGTVGVSENIIEASWEALVDSVEYGLSHPKQENEHH
ncbi:MAG: citramalate synthase [Actinobacteria bacterium HGW-Actinobacteria-6]|jgi:2-isopropylmalate synthase|nr:MAG: citramalate synthase [Actinobacteria bacterium HGW-Actinobacteria-6]